MARNLRSSTIDGAAYSVMVGLGETFLPAFVLAIGLGEVVAGLSASIPLLCGAILQMISPAAVRRIGSRRRWVVLCAVGQAMCFVPLAMAALAGRISVLGVLTLATIYWATALGAGPAWNTWMGHLVPVRLRASFFAHRTRIAQAAVLLGLVTGGLTLQWSKGQGETLRGFAMLFIAAATCRMVSAAFLFRQDEVPLARGDERRLEIRDVGRRLKSDGGRLILYMFAMQAATYLAAPFFTPFMISQLKLSYGSYVMMLAASFLAKSFALAAIGRFAHRFGARRLLWFGGVAVVPLGAMWLVSSALPYLLVTQLIAGVAWASYELATVLMLYETIPNNRRTSVLTLYNVINAVAIVSGSAIGAMILKWNGETHRTYFILFAASSLCRLLTVPMLRRIADVPRIPGVVLLRSLTVRPSAGSIDRPIISVIPQANAVEQTNGRTD